MPSPLRSCDYRTHEPDDSLHTVEVALLLAPLLAPLLLRALLLLLALLLPKCVSEKIDRMAPRMMAAAGGEAVAVHSDDNYKSAYLLSYFHSKNES